MVFSRPSVIMISGALLLSLADYAHALPPFKNMWRSRYGSTNSCMSCHRSGDWRLNPYGKEFLRLGRSHSALETLELMDPDQDSFVTKKEIQSQSNPGDERSKPGQIGDWLMRPDPVLLAPHIPERYFSKGVDVTEIGATLSQAEKQSIELRLNAKLRDEDSYPTLFLIRESTAPEAAPIGRGTYVMFGEHTLSSYILFTDTEGVIRGLHPLSVHGDRRLSKQVFLSQFIGLKRGDLQRVAPPYGAEADTALLLDAARRSLIMLEMVRR
ncbi:MAG TPA: hypothetical protein PK876_07840 [Elusimicrobiota bacterium]|nr:hypothetical protein [Elusimicrobiota bacterium]